MIDVYLFIYLLIYVDNPCLCMGEFLFLLRMNILNAHIHIFIVLSDILTFQ